MDIELPDGTIIQDVPEGTTKAQLIQKLQAGGVSVPAEWLSKPSVPAAQPQQQQQESPLMKYGVRPVKELVGAVAEPLLAMGTGMAGKIAGDIGGLAAIPLHAAGIGQKEPAKVKEDIQSALQYEPRTELGKLTTKPIELLGRGIEAGAEALTSPVENEYLRAGLKEAALQAPGLIGARLSQVRAARGEKTQAMQAERDALRLQAQEKGLITPPTAGVKKFIYNTGKVSDEVSLKNQNTITSLVAEDVGLPKGKPITADAIENRRVELNKAYSDITSELPTGVNVTNTFQNKLRLLTSDFQKKQQSNPKTFDQADTLKVAREHLQPSGKVLAADDIMENIKALRERATKADTSNDVTAAKTYRKIADEYEQMIADNLKAKNKSSVYSAFEDARRQLAKLYVVEKSVDSSGLVNPKLLKTNIGTTLAKRKYATGNIDLVSKFADQFESAAKYITPEKAATLGKWEATVPLSALAQSVGTGTAAGMGFGPSAGMLAGGVALGLPAGLGILGPKLGTLGYLQNAPSYVPYKTRVATSGLATSPYVRNEEEQ